MLLPVLRQTAERQTQYSRRQIGIALALRQNQKPAVIDDQPKSPCPLTRAPADPALACLKMQSRRAERQYRHPLPVDFGDIPQPLSSQSATLKVVLLAQVIVERAEFLLAQQPNRYAC